jgi:predicted secreted hydrolase
MNKWIIIGVAALLIGLVLFPFDRPESPPKSAAESATEVSRLSELLGSQADSGYAMAVDQREFSFPRDHGPHPDFRNEWWYLTGNLDARDGQRFGYELTLFRFSLAPGFEPETAQNDSNWRTDQVYIAHFAVTDEANEQFHVEQRFSRGALGLAGAQVSPFRVWIEDWVVTDDTDAVLPGGAENWRLRASGDQVSLELKLSALKSPVLNGINGLSQKSAEAGNASYYYSITRMQSAGVLQIGPDKYPVDGLSWLDREWSSSALSADQQGWDWFALQLSDGSDLMFYNLRKRDGSQDQHSAGTWTGAEGVSRHLSRDEVAIAVTGQWQNPAGDSYPARWNIEIDSLGLALTVAPVIADQELLTTVRYWEGAVDVEGKHDGISIEGRGYVELTGYSQ